MQSRGLYLIILIKVLKTNPQISILQIEAE